MNPIAIGKKIASAAAEKKAVETDVRSAAQHYANFTRALERAAYQAGEHANVSDAGDAYKMFLAVLKHADFKVWSKVKW